MTEFIDDSRYSKGTGIFSVYENVKLSTDVKKRCNELYDLGNDTVLANNFFILGVIPYPALGAVGVTEVLKYSWILSESHRVLIYDPSTQVLIDELYTCCPVKDGRVMFERTNKRLGAPVQTFTLKEIVNKEMAMKEEPDKLFHSVPDAAQKLGLKPRKNYCVSCVFFDMPERQLDEDSLEQTLTRALNKDDQKPVIESTCRYDPQGYTYIHQSPKHFAGLHSYPGTLKSAHLSVIGSGSAILSVLDDVEDVVYKRRKTEPTISVKIVAEDF